MKNEIKKKEFSIAENKMNELLAVVTKKGGFANLTKKEITDLNKYTQLVKTYENLHYPILKIA